MKIINNYATYKVNGREIIIISNNYNGNPKMFYNYDVMIVSKDIIKKYRKELFPKTKSKKETLVRYI